MLTETQPMVAELVSRRVETAVVPSSVYTVFTADGLAFGGCFGTADTGGREPTLDTAYRIASCTKSFTAAAILQLRDADALRLDDPISDYVDIGTLELPKMVRPLTLTVGALLSMSGGLATDNAWADRQESMSTAAFEALCADGFTLISPPGTCYEYSNLGYAVLGRVIERASGLGYREFIVHRLLRPLGLHHAAFEASQLAAPGGVAEGFRRVDNGWEPVPVSGPGAFSAIGGLFMSASDLTTWCAWLAAGYALGASGDDVLAASSRREMQTLHQLDRRRRNAELQAGGYGFGLEVEIYDVGIIVSHRGGYPGFSAQMAWHLDTGIGVVIVENAPYAQSPAITALRRVLATVPAPDPEPWPATLRAREGIERLLAQWDDTLADQIFADNLDVDRPRRLRRAEFNRVAERIDFTKECLGQALDICQPLSNSAAHLEWTARGHLGGVRCAVTLTSLKRPRVQSIVLRDSTIEKRPATD